MSSEQQSSLRKRTVNMIKEYPEPKQLFELIHRREYPYADKSKQRFYGIRDRGMMGAAVCSAGRISEVVGGDRYKSVPVEGQFKTVMVKGVLTQRQVKKPIKVGKHSGILAENVKPKAEGYILIEKMGIVKRSEKVIIKYGEAVTQRDPFIIPLKKGLFDNPFWDQLVPFGWLLLEYLKAYPIKEGKLFPYERYHAYKIISQVTGQYPNWFRAQSEHFYGNYLLTDSVRLAKFVGVVRAEQVGHYIGYAWQALLKESQMDFKWVDAEVRKIKERLINGAA